MLPRLPDSPAKLAALAMASYLIPSIFFVHPPLRDPHFADRVPVVIAGIAVFAVCAFLSLKCVSTLRNGIENKRWPESQVEPLRNHFDQPLYTILSLALFVAFTLLEFATKHYRGEGWVCYLVLQTISQLRIALKRPIPTTPGPLADWRNFGPIRSDHWGQR